MQKFRLKSMDTPNLAFCPCWTHTGDDSCKHMSDSTDFTCITHGQHESPCLTHGQRETSTLESHPTLNEQ